MDPAASTLTSEHCHDNSSPPLSFAALPASTESTVRVQFSRDASIYQKTPKTVFQPRHLHDIASILFHAKAQGESVTWRTGGTSLSGQAVTDSWLVDLNPHWNSFRIEDHGRRITSEPAVTGAHLNGALAPFQRKIGPDPASLSAAKFGGILANNASGMCCGTRDNAYQTLYGMTLMLADGICVDTRNFQESLGTLQQASPHILRGLERIRAEILERPLLCQKIQSKYRIKNTTGISINALVDFAHPIGMLQHLMIGSEGTLGFIANATLHTVTLPSAPQTAMLFFESMDAACAIVPRLCQPYVTAVEIMDRDCLLASLPILSQYGKQSIDEREAALLIEWEATDDANPIASIEVKALRQSLGPVGPGQLRADLWKVRKSLLATVGGRRTPGSSLVIEDVAVKPERLSAFYRELKHSLQACGFQQSVVFGHARDGNLHFVLELDTRSEKTLQGYRHLMDELVTLVCRYEGSLKAEHGTGINMAPFVKKEWGPEIYGWMEAVKQLLDPHNTLNRGVIFAANEQVHLHDIKGIPTLNNSLDACIECGFCESVCPSNTFTLSPRQRIISLRRQPQLAPFLSKDSRFALMDTCAADGVCAQACPVGINVGDMVKQLRTTLVAPQGKILVQDVSQHLASVEKLTSVFIHLANWLPSSLSKFLSHSLARWSDHIPQWHEGISPAGIRYSRSQERESAENEDTLNLFPTCMSRLLKAHNTMDCVHAWESIAHQLQEDVTISCEWKGQCCGQAFASKGFEHAALEARHRWFAQATKLVKPGGRILVDNPSCRQHLIRDPAAKDFRWFSEVDMLQPLSPFTDPKPKQIRFFPGCSLSSERAEQIIQQLRRIGFDPVRPLSGSGCCGSAGDRGFIVPKLTQNAISRIDWPHASLDVPIITMSPSCQISLAAYSGASVIHLAELIRTNLA